MPNWKKVVVSGSDATLNSLYVAGPITGSDVKINDWGSVSASLAAIESGASTQTLQDVTDNGNTTTNSIEVAGINVSSSGIISTGNLTIGKELPFIILSHTASFGIQTGGGLTMRSDAYSTAPSGTVMGSISVADGNGGVRGGIRFSKDSDSSTNLDFYNSVNDVPKLIISSSTVETPSVFKTAQYTTGSDAYIDKWGSISASLASISSGASTLTLQDVTNNGNTTTNSIIITGSLNVQGNSNINGEININNDINVTGTGYINVQNSSGFVFDGRRTPGDTSDNQTLLRLYNSGSTGQAFGKSSRIILTSEGLGRGDIYYGVNGFNELTFEIGTGTKLVLSGSTNTKDYLFSNALSPNSTSSLSWGQSVGGAFIQKTYNNAQTQFLGNATTATTATTASYALTSSYSSVPLSTVLSNGNTANNSIYLNGLWNNVLRIGLEGGTVPPAPSQSVGLGLHGSQIYWSGSTPDGGTASTPATNNKAVDQFHYDNNNISIGGKLYVFSGVSIGTGSFHSVHCDYTLFSSNNITNNVSNVRAGSLIVAVDDSNRISYTEYSTPMTSGSQDIDTTNLNIEIVGGALQCWISSASSPYSVCKSRITIM